MMKLTIPAPVQLTMGEERVYPFADFVAGLCALDRRFNASARGAFAAERLLAALKGKNEGDVVDLESTDGELLKQVGAEPSDGYPLRPVHPVAAFLRAIEAIS